MRAVNSAAKAPASKATASQVKASKAARPASATNGKSAHAPKVALKAVAPSKPLAKLAAKPALTKSVAAKATLTVKAAAPAKGTSPVNATSPLKAAPPLKTTSPVRGTSPVKAAPPIKANAVKANAVKANAVKANAAVKLVPPPAAPPKKPARKSIKEAAGVSTDAVMRRTGKSWDDWFEVLDNAGAETLDQRGVVAILAQKHGIGPWWQQMIAVGYESLRNKSDKPPAPDGFQINSSCTLDAPLPRVFRLWNDAGERARWLADDRFVVRGATADKIIRARWGKGTSHVAVSFSEKSGRTEVSVDHHQIESRGAAEQMKAYWAKKLGLLDQALAPRR